jgi:hypothetical protein
MNPLAWRMHGLVNCGVQVLIILYIMECSWLALCNTVGLPLSVRALRGKRDHNVSL